MATKPKKMCYGKSFQIKKASQSKSKLVEKKCQKDSDLKFIKMKVITVTSYIANSLIMHVAIGII